jgi:hypothetical protein
MASSPPAFFLYAIALRASGRRVKDDIRQPDAKFALVARGTEEFGGA